MGTYNILANPEKYSPVNAPMWIESNYSDNSSVDFKYLYEVYNVDQGTGITYSLGNFRIPPRPNGNGLFTPNKILRSEVSYNIGPFATQSIAASQSITRWGYSYGFEYNPGVTFSGLTASASPYAGKTLIGYTNGYPHVTGVFQNGDYIRLEFNSTVAIQGYYGGDHTILDVVEFGGYSFIAIDLDYNPDLDPTQSGGIEPNGTITNLARAVGDTGGTSYSFNGTRQYEEIGRTFSNYNVFKSTSLIPVNGSADASMTCYPLTNYPYFTNKRVLSNNYEILSFMIDDVHPYINGSSYLVSEWYARYTLYTETNSTVKQFGYYIGQNESTDTGRQWHRYDIPVGLQNLLDGGYINIGDVSNTDHWTVELVYIDHTSYVQITKMLKTYQLYIDCSPNNHIRLAFQNRGGGFDYFNFNWKSVNSLTTAKTEFRKVLDWNYNVGDRQDTVLAQKAQETWTISSDFISDIESKWLKEIITSPEVYVVDEVNKIYIPIIITNTDYVVRTRLNDKQFSISLSYKLAYDITLQNS